MDWHLKWSLNDEEVTWMDLPEGGDIGHFPSMKEEPLAVCVEMLPTTFQQIADINAFHVLLAPLASGDCPDWVNGMVQQQHRLGIMH